MTLYLKYYRVKKKKTGSFSLIERVILSAGAMLIFSVYFHLTKCPEGHRSLLKLNYIPFPLAEFDRLLPHGLVTIWCGPGDWGQSWLYGRGKFFSKNNSKRKEQRELITRGLMEGNQIKEEEKCGRKAGVLTIIRPAQGRKDFALTPVPAGRLSSSTTQQGYEPISFLLNYWVNHRFCRHVLCVNSNADHTTILLHMLRRPVAFFLSKRHVLS